MDCNTMDYRDVFLGYGDPGGTRTPYLQIRNLSLYPDELRDHSHAVYSYSPTAARRIAQQGQMQPLINV